MSVVFARILKCYLSCDCYDIKEFTFPTAWHMGTPTRPSLADQGPAAAQLTTVAQLVSPGFWRENLDWFTGQIERTISEYITT